MTIECAPPSRGAYRMVFFDSPVRFGTYSSMGEIDVLAE